jgi:hypothetical protein
MQKTIALGFGRYTAQKIIALTTGKTNGDDYISILEDGALVYWNYRKHEDYYWPVCKRNEADSIGIECPIWGISYGQYRELSFDPSKNPAAAALGFIKTAIKSTASRENGKLGGRPRNAK